MNYRLRPLTTRKRHELDGMVDVLRGYLAEMKALEQDNKWKWKQINDLQETIDEHINSILKFALISEKPKGISKS